MQIPGQWQILSALSYAHPHGHLTANNVWTNHMAVTLLDGVEEFMVDLPIIIDLIQCEIFGNES